MKDTVYVIVNKVGFQRALKTDSFDLRPGERAFKLAIEVPDEAFAPQRLPTVRLMIPSDQLQTVIEAEIGEAYPGRPLGTNSGGR